MDLSQGLLLKKLILKGHRKDYEVTFRTGINIIHGDMDTGKSSILRLIYFLLGGKQIKLDEEITSSVKYVVLEISINGFSYCISRDIFNPSRDIDVYSCIYSEISKSFPDKYKSSVTKGDEKNKSLSDFLLERLELPLVRLKQAPTKDSSKTARLSFLDLFKFMYLDQDAVGSTHMMNIGNHVLETKNREVFKYIFSVLDSNISEIEADISKKTKEKIQLTNEYVTITDFLFQTNFKDINEINDEIINIDRMKIEIKNRISNLNGRMTSDSELYKGLKYALNTINSNIKKQELVRITALRNIEKFTRLLNDYQNDIDRIKASLSSKVIIGETPIEKINCPICETLINVGDVSEKFNIPSKTRLKGELTSISRRLKGLKQLILDNRTDLEIANSLLTELYVKNDDARKLIDEKLESSISPYLAERDAMIKELARFNGHKEKAVHSLRVRNKQGAIADQIGRLESAVKKLNIRLDEFKKNSPSLETVLADLGVDINKFIKKVKINNQRGVGIDKRTFFPFIRNIEYRKINSGGLRTIVSIGYLAAILEQKLRKETNIPGLLMIDTVGKFLGKTSDATEEIALDNINEFDGVADPEKYKNLFEALVNITSKFDEQNQLCQIILVDNDIPHDVTYENQEFEIAHFRSNGINGLPVGLIDDWNPTR